MNQSSQEEDTTSPFLVNINDVPLSKAEITRYQTEASRIDFQIERLTKQVRLAKWGIVGSAGTGLLSMMNLVAISILERHIDWLYVAVAILFSFMWGYFVYSRTRDAEKIDLLLRKAPSRLDLIDSDPAACEAVSGWIKEYPEIKVYVHKIAALGRMPTRAEFHCIECWVKSHEENKPVERLREELNVSLS